MCYILKISTDLPDDMAKYNDEHLFFEKTDKTAVDSVLQYANVYEIATMSAGSCSCNLRIFDETLAREVGFCELQDWLDEEDDEDYWATQRFFDVIQKIVNQGFKVDSFLSWNEDLPSEIEKIQKIQVAVNTLPKAHFAFFENGYFEYYKPPLTPPKEGELRDGKYKSRLTSAP